MAEDTIDTLNTFGVGVQVPDTIHIMGSVPSLLTRDDALNLAAYLVVLADDDMGGPEGKFARLLAAILDT